MPRPDYPIEGEECEEDDFPFPDLFEDEEELDFFDPAFEDGWREDT